MRAASKYSPTPSSRSFDKSRMLLLDEIVQLLLPHGKVRSKTASTQTTGAAAIATVERQAPACCEKRRKANSNRRWESDRICGRGNERHKMTGQAHQAASDHIDSIVDDVMNVPEKMIADEVRYPIAASGMVIAISRQLIGGQLLKYELVIGLVLVQRLNDIVSIEVRPGVRLFFEKDISLVVGVTERCQCQYRVHRSRQRGDASSRSISRSNASGATGRSANSSTSSGVGGRPTRSNEARRRSVRVRRSAIAAGLAAAASDLFQDGDQRVTTTRNRAARTGRRPSAPVETPSGSATLEIGLIPPAWRARANRDRSIWKSPPSVRATIVHWAAFSIHRRDERREPANSPRHRPTSPRHHDRRP